MHDSDTNTDTPKAPRLLERVRDAIKRRHYSDRTEETYVHWVKRFIYFSGKRHPMEMGAAEVTAFLNHLARDREVRRRRKTRRCRRCLAGCAGPNGSWRVCCMARASGFASA